MQRSRWGFALALVGVAVLAAAGPAGAKSSNGRIAFSTGFVLPYGDRDVGSQVFTVNPGGGGLRQLTHVAGGHDAADPAWSPDGRRIAYQSNPTGEYDLWVMNADGSNQHRILRDAGWDDEQPSWSPDGRRLVFARCSPLFACDIDVVNCGRLRQAPDRRRPSRQFVSELLAERPLDPLHLRPRRPAQRRLEGAGAGGRAVRLTPARLEAFAPGWSPDGSRIVFTNDCCLPFSEVYVMHADGTHIRRLTHAAPGHQNSFARFSPDGQRIVFMSDRAYPDGCCNELYTMRTDGSDVHRVTHLAASGELADWGRAP